MGTLMQLGCWINLDTESLVSIGEECEEWPVQKCTLTEKVVKKSTPETGCDKVPKEVCVNERVNPKKVSRPVVKEWCYKPSDLKEPTSRLALSQFFNKKQ